MTANDLSLDWDLEDLWELEWDVEQGTATEPDVAEMGRLPAENADGIQDELPRQVPDGFTVRVKKLRAAAGRAKEAGEEAQDACHGKALVSESSEACQDVFDKLLASSVEVSQGLAALGADGSNE